MTYAETVHHMLQYSAVRHNGTGLLHEVLDEFYAEGAEVFLSNEIIDPDQHVWVCTTHVSYICIMLY